MRQRTITAWFLVHKWTSLVCTAFLLMLCVTGLPLIFLEEIDGALNPPPPLPVLAADHRPVTLDAVLARALAERPGEVPIYLSFDEERPVAYVTTGPRADAPGADMHFTAHDRRTAATLPAAPKGVMDVILQIHVDMFLGLKGELFLGAMGLLFFAAIVSGVVLYAPFMARLRFGTVRRDRSARVARLDRHNLLGVVTLAWASVVGITGTINTLALPLTSVWKADQLARMRGGGGAAPVAATASVDRALADALRAVPGTRAQFVAFPGAAYSSNRHLAVFLQGATPLTKRLLTPVFVDAQTGHIEAIAQAPWYMAMLLLAQPLHFGDYGGPAMKIAWALLDIATIAVLWTGLRLWLGRRRHVARDNAIEVASAGLVSAA